MTTGKRVLVVDDDDHFRDVSASLLRSSGYAVDEARNGAVAIERLGEALPDLVLLDLCMPEVDGWGVLSHVGHMLSRPRVVVMSGVREVVPPGNLSQWITGYVFKPFRPGQLVRTCEDAIGRPRVVPGGESRREPRRTFLADATVLGDGGMRIAHGLLVEVSTGGLRLELDVALEAERHVAIAFRVPGYPNPIEIPGIVRWCDARTMGTEIATVSAGDDAVLRALVDLE
jgi:CheY-like chemotaxis protein